MFNVLVTVLLSFISFSTIAAEYIYTSRPAYKTEVSGTGVNTKISIGEVNSVLSPSFSAIKINTSTGVCTGCGTRLSMDTSIADTYMSIVHPTATNYATPILNAVSLPVGSGYAAPSTATLTPQQVYSFNTQLASAAQKKILGEVAAIQVLVGATNSMITSYNLAQIKESVKGTEAQAIDTAISALKSEVDTSKAEVFNPIKGMVVPTLDTNTTGAYLVSNTYNKAGTSTLKTLAVYEQGVMSQQKLCIASGCYAPTEMVSIGKYATSLTNGYLVADANGKELFTANYASAVASTPLFTLGNADGSSPSKVTLTYTNLKSSPNFHSTIGNSLSVAGGTGTLSYDWMVAPNSATDKAKITAACGSLTAGSDGTCGANSYATGASPAQGNTSSWNFQTKATLTFN